MARCARVAFARAIVHNRPIEVPGNWPDELPKRPGVEEDYGDQTFPGLRIAVTWAQSYRPGAGSKRSREVVGAVRAVGACFIGVPMPYSFHVARFDDTMHVTALEDIAQSALRINGGFFALRRSIFDEMNPNEELVVEPFARLIQRRELTTVAHDGFWHNMDTFKDKILFDELYASGNRPWQVWDADH